MERPGIEVASVASTAEVVGTPSRSAAKSGKRPAEEHVQSQDRSRCSTALAGQDIVSLTAIYYFSSAEQILSIANNQAELHRGYSAETLVSSHARGPGVACVPAWLGR